jgi:membrane associated rhomboid family serine protease
MMKTDYGMRKFWAGYITCAAVNSLVQDYYGKEVFLKMMANGWLDAKYTVPAAIIALIFAYQLFAKSFPPKDKLEDELGE